VAATTRAIIALHFIFVPHHNQKSRAQTIGFDISHLSNVFSETEKEIRAPSE
jgi:hypothetical protein